MGLGQWMVHVIKSAIFVPRRPSSIFCCQVTTNVPDFNHHKGTKTLRTPRISKLFLFFVPLWLRVFVVSSRATLVVTLSNELRSCHSNKTEYKHQSKTTIIRGISQKLSILDVFDSFLRGRFNVGAFFRISGRLRSGRFKPAASGRPPSAGATEAIRRRSLWTPVLISSPRHLGAGEEAK